jgi:FkbM family methyltransferase
MVNKTSVLPGNYCQRVITQRLFGKEGYRFIKMLKVVLDFKLGIPYEISGFLKKVVRKNDIIFDIGANLGQYAIRLNDLVRKGRVISFEPVSQNYKLLLKLNLKNVDVKNLALSDFIGRHEFIIPITRHNVEIDTRSHLNILRHPNIDNHWKCKKEIVMCSTIERVFAELKLKKIDIIKSDAEAHDSLVLKGGKAVIVRYKPLILVEASPDSEWLHEYLSLGYERFYMMRKTYLAISVERANDVLVNKSLLILIHKNDKYHRQFVI